MNDLNTRQEQVARYVAIGFSDARIAAALEISEGTVAYHIGKITEIWRLDRSRNIRVQITQRLLSAA